MVSTFGTLNTVLLDSEQYKVILVHFALHNKLKISIPIVAIIFNRIRLNDIEYCH